MYDPEIGTGKAVSGFGADVISVSDKPAAPTSSPSPTNPPPAAVSPATTVAASASTLVLAALSALLL